MFGPCLIGSACRRGSLSSLRARSDHAVNISCHLAKISCEPCKEFAFPNVIRQPADKLAILGFREQLFEFCPKVFYLSESLNRVRRVISLRLELLPFSSMLRPLALTVLPSDAPDFRERPSEPFHNR